MSRKIPVAEHLTDNQYKVLQIVYANHNSSMSLKERVNYDLSHMVKVEVNKEENCLNVHYDTGEWWHYCPDGTWY